MVFARFPLLLTLAAVTALPVLADESVQDHWKVIETYCFKCHNTEDWAGSIAFDSMTMNDVPGDAETWEKAVRKLRGHLMPPPGKPQPDPAAVKSLISYLETTMDTAADGKPHVGRVGLHRL